MEHSVLIWALYIIVPIVGMVATILTAHYFKREEQK